MRETPQLDLARLAADELHDYVTADDELQRSTALRAQLVAAEAYTLGMLAIAEALHGVIFVANANAE